MRPKLEFGSRVCKETFPLCKLNLQSLDLAGVVAMLNRLHNQELRLLTYLLTLDTGVVVVTLGGYFLAFSTSQTSVKKSDAVGDEGRGSSSPTAADQRGGSGPGGSAEESYGGGLEMIANLTVAGDAGARTTFYGAVVRILSSLCLL
jgi:hypothetical protein